MRILDDADLSFLPRPEELELNCRIFAALDAVIESDWQYRYYSYDPTWGPASRMASLRTGSGDHWHAVFERGQAFVKGFTRDVIGPSGPKGWPASLFADAVPTPLQEHLNEPAFYVEETGFCLWWDEGWRGVALEIAGANTDLDRLRDVAAGAGRYAEWACEYYEVKLDAAEIAPLWRGGSLSRALVLRLVAEADLDSLDSELRSLGLSIASE